MRKTDKIGFEDIFDLVDIEKIFEQTLEGDILKLMTQWEKESKEKEQKTTTFQKDEQELYIEKIVRRVIQEEIGIMARGSGLFGERFCRGLESQGVERNCPTCMYNANKHYCKVE
ncbi:MAG TPA: hypothetical protein IAB45_06625 [Candidatus Onthousia faecavium]|nr:hypothetical protein [Candidatus Onthousia faecavium]